MRSAWIGLLLGSLLSLPLLSFSHPDASLHYSDRPPLAHTGGFGEPTCRACHFDQPLNAPNGSLAIEGLPNAYTAGQRYRLTVRLQRPEMGRGGFQLSARFASGAQAGSLRAADEQRATIVQVDSTGVQYAAHTRAGTEPVAPDTARWVLEWTAPDTTAGPVLVHVAANAANFDASEFGDFIYTAQQRVGAPGSR